LNILPLHLIKTFFLIYGNKKLLFNHLKIFGMKTKSIQKQQVSVESQNELFNQYVNPYLDFIYWICIRYTICGYYIDDNYNEVQLLLYKYIHTYNPERPLKTWLYAVVSRAVREMSRRHSVMASEKCEFDFSNFADPDSWYYDVESSRKADYLTNYRLLFSDDVLWALEQLNPIFRETLLLSLAGYTMREIASISYRAGNLEHLNEDTVKSRLFLARKYMKRLIDRYGRRRV
jgi:RNA polymerase sigma factor (sigma-70 family)